MAVEKQADGTYRVGRMTFATSEEAFSFDTAVQMDPQPPIQAPPPESRPATRARRSVSSAAAGPFPRLASSLAVLVLLTGAAALYFGPHWTVYRMKAAIEAKDATAFSSYVDFPALKESVKAQLMIKMGNLMKSNDMKDNPFAGLGQMIGLGMINQMVDSLVSPAGVMLMLAKGEASPAKPVPPTPGTDIKPSPNFAIKYINYSTAEILSKDGAPGRFILRRDGLFAWKLSGIDMPL